jgi:hypothetical protein
MNWRKSTYSAANGSCVELATEGGMVYVRDSKDPEGGTLALSPESWRALLDGAKAGELDDML